MFTEIYDGLFLVGVFGLIAQGILGGMHGGIHATHHASGGGHAHGGNHAHGAAGHENHAAHNTQSGSRFSSLFLMLLSPLTLFSICLGAGAAGLIAQKFVPNHVIVAILAAVCGTAFFGLIVRPIFKLIVRFQSNPAESLDGAVAQEAEVVSRFNEKGEGIVRLTIDGQFVRILARLDPSEGLSPSDIALGDRLTVTSIDSHNNTCNVAKL